MNKKSFAARLTSSLLLLAAAGCTTIDPHVRVADWPELRVIEHHVGYREMAAHCRKYVGFLMTPLGCTEFNFAAGEAHIYVTPDLPLGKNVLEHERLHAAGYDHVGSTQMAELWHKWEMTHRVSGQASHADAAAALPSGVAASELGPDFLGRDTTH